MKHDGCRRRRLARRCRRFRVVQRHQEPFQDYKVHFLHNDPVPWGFGFRHQIPALVINVIKGIPLTPLSEIRVLIVGCYLPVEVIGKSKVLAAARDEKRGEIPREVGIVRPRGDAGGGRRSGTGKFFHEKTIADVGNGE